MLVIPAIDLMDGKVVRLVQGKAHEMTVYSEDPVHIADQWVIHGAKLIHVVDLDGALSGKMKNLPEIRKIINHVKIPVEVGGGIRSIETISILLDEINANSVVLGTGAIEDKEFLKKAINKWSERIIISIDASHGMVFEKGWTQAAMIKPMDLAKQIIDLGVKTIIYTDISRDGTMKGPNIKGIEELLSGVKGVRVILSGGVSCFEDIKALVELEKKGLSGVIVGKALYEDKIILREAIGYAE